MTKASLIQDAVAELDAKNVPPENIAQIVGISLDRVETILDHLAVNHRTDHTCASCGERAPDEGVAS